MDIIICIIVLSVLTLIFAIVPCLILFSILKHDKLTEDDLKKMVMEMYKNSNNNLY